MITININHAFDGFLYAPLFLASELGFFPKCAKLVFRNGDSQCLDALCQHNDSLEKNWFAICDPFSVDLSTKIATHTGDELCVVGCLVDKLPVWVFNPDPAITAVQREQQLAKYSERIQKVICYKETTTGYLLGKRLQTILRVKNADLETRDFGNEFASTVPNDAAVATSDVLRVVHSGLTANKIIFNYATQSPEELRPFLFTGILTLKKEVLDGNLWAVLTLLAGLKHATDLLREKNIRPECLKILTKHFQPQLVAMGVTAVADQEKLIQASILYAFQTEDLYSESLKPEKEAWDHAQKQWETIMGRTFVDTEVSDEPIPTLLIKRNWRRDAELRKRINEGFPDLVSVVGSRLIEWYHCLTLVVAVPAVLLCLLALLNSLHKATAPFRDNFPFIVFGWASFIGLTVCCIMLFKNLLKGDRTHFAVYLGIAATGIASTLLSALQLIK